MKEGYIKRKTSTIPFGYETSEVTGYFKPVPEQIHALEVVSEMVHGDEISLAVGDLRVLSLLIRFLLNRKQNKQLGNL